MTKNRKLGSKGFTLIELLIVIIIIGILAAIAFVAYSGAQAKAHKSAAQSTLAEAKNKLAEYNADKGYYPDSKATFITWLESADGGNSNTFAGSDGENFGNTGYTYSATEEDGTTACTSGDTGCALYKITASASALQFKGSDLTVNN